MMPGQSIFISDGNKENLKSITKVTYSKPFEYCLWTFINAKGETALVSGPLYSSEVYNRLMEVCVSLCNEKVEVYSPLMNQEAKAALQEALDSYSFESGYSECMVIGYYPNENGTFTAFDNTTADCWVEDFNSELQAVAYLLSDYTTSEQLIHALNR